MRNGKHLTPAPFEGKTYSLVGPDLSSREYFVQIRLLADDLARRFGGASELLAVVRALSGHRRRLTRLSSLSSDHTPESALLHSLREALAPQTTKVAAHLRDLSLRQRWDRTLRTTEPQYHLAMLEIELVNRLNVARFRSADTRLAFLPHCLRDLSAECQSAHRGDDYVCKGCTAGCSINHVSKLLRRHGVTPYIWMTANLPSLLRRLRREGRTVGVLGIACVPELVNGMRSCARLDVPAVGIPLDANRCARWWGEFHPNTVNAVELAALLGRETLLGRRHRGTALNGSDRRIP